MCYASNGAQALAIHTPSDPCTAGQVAEDSQLKLGGGEPPSTGLVRVRDKKRISRRVRKGSSGPRSAVVALQRLTVQEGRSEQAKRGGRCEHYGVLDTSQLLCKSI